MELGQVVATRTFSVNEEPVELLIGAPRAYPDGNDYFCPFQVKGIGDERVRHAGGIDGLQALILAVERAAMYLSSTEEVRGGQLKFLGETGIGFGPSTD
jgi:hypothetical protein